MADQVAGIARRQHGRIAHRQLLRAGVDPERIKRWSRNGRLRRVHRDVYALGHDAPSLLGDLMAAVLAAGEGAVVSHASAAHLLRLCKERPPRPEVTVPTRAGRNRPGITIRRVRALHRLDRFHHSTRIPVTTPARTLLDLAPHMAPLDLTAACHEAWVNHKTRPGHIEACIARNPHKAGARKLQIALGGNVTLSHLERGYLKLLAANGLPLPQTNIDHAGDKVDCHWPHLALTIELLSYRYHATRQGFETDVARRRRSGHVAYTYGDVFERGRATAREVAVLLRA